MLQSERDGATGWWMCSWHNFNIHRAGAGAGRDMERGFLDGSRRLGDLMHWAWQSQRNRMAGLGSGHEVGVAKANKLFLQHLMGGYVE